MSQHRSPRRPPPERIIVLYNPKVERSAELAAAISRELQSRSSITVLESTIENGGQGQDLAEQDLIVVIGGDGSMLRAGSLVARHRLPILGVNLGRLGFLGEVQPSDWPEKLSRVLEGDYWLEERMMLHVEHWRGAQKLGGYEALNEAVVGRGALARPVRLKTLIDGEELVTYVADGLIVATPTGSTAYALAAGGPILPPELKNILLIAIAPHLSIDRGIVLPQGATVDVIVRTEHEAILSADGQFEVPLRDGDRVHMRMSEYLTHFVRVRPRNYFYSSLMERMQKNPSADKGK